MDSAKLAPNRSGIWEIRWSEKDDAKGRWRTRSVSTRTTDRAAAEAVMAAFVQAERDLAARRSATGAAGTVGAVLDGYEQAATARKVGDTQKLCVKTLRAALGALRVEDLTPSVILDYRKARGVSDGTLRRELNTLVAALNWGAKHRVIAGPAPVIDLPAEGAPRAVFLDENLESDLWGIASRDTGQHGRLSRVGRFICLGLATGARKAAIEGLTWDRVDLTRGVIDFRDPYVRATKKRRIATPIPERLAPVLRRMLAERIPGSDYVLDHDGDIKKPWATFMARHGFDPSVTPHVLRHTRITLLLRAGVSVWDVSALVGASPAVIQDVYGHHVADARLAAQANRRFASAA